jgi:hypothetical protein
MHLHGDLRRMDMRPLTQEDLEHLLYPLLDDQKKNDLEETGAVSFTHVVGAEECRFACTVAINGGQLSLSSRFLERI